MSWGLMAVTILLNFCLVWTGRGQFDAVTIAVIGSFNIFINGGYITQNICRDLSTNKEGIHIPDGGDKHYIEKEGVN
jgi:hypothetical protein